MSADYSLELISIETYAPQFIGPNDFFLGSVQLVLQSTVIFSSKTAPRILIFSITMSANYSLELISIETYVPQFLGPNDFFLGSVQRVLQSTVILDKGVCKISENGSAKKLPGSFCLFQKNARQFFFPTILGTVRLLDS